MIRARRAAAALVAAVSSLSLVHLAQPPAASAAYDGAPVTARKGGDVALTWAPLYMTDDHHYTAAEARSLAERFDVVIAMPVALKTHVARMRKVNPDLVVLAYSAATLRGKKDTAGVPESAFAHDEHGRRITYLPFGTWLMEGTSPAWKRLAATECRQRAAQGGYDGCLVDMLGDGVVSAKRVVSGRPVNPATGRPWTSREYTRNMAALMAAFRAADPTLVHVGNAVGNKYRYWQATPTSQLATDTMSAAQMEDFLRGARDATGDYPSAKDWRLNVEVVRDFEAKGKAGLFTTKLWSGASAAQAARWQRYAMASFLMGANGRSYFAFTKSRTQAGATQANLPHRMPRNLGAPRGAMTQLASGAWTRSFANGMTVVNPTRKAVTVALPRRMSTLAGATVTRLRLPATSGEVLVG